MGGSSPAAASGTSLLIRASCLDGINGSADQSGESGAMDNVEIVDEHSVAPDSPRRRS